MRIACFHTADSNVAVFEVAAAELGLRRDSLRHEVRADLLLAAERAGGLTPEIARETRAALLDLARNADAVVLTCSTLGPSVAAIEESAPAPVLRGDGALADRAVEAGREVAVVCAVETTIESTRRLFVEAARRTGAEIRIRPVPGAWALFKAGDRSGYLAAVAQAAESAYDEGASIVALAQASMADAADLVTRGPRPLSSPTIALAAAIERLGRRS